MPNFFQGAKPRKSYPTNGRLYGTESFPELKGKADYVFSQWIRRRDAKGLSYIYCFICETKVMIGQAHCGHYSKRGNMANRYSEINCHAICENCNREDDTARYRALLVAVYGEDAIQQLEHAERSLMKFSREDLREIVLKYSKN